VHKTTGEHPCLRRPRPAGLCDGVPRGRLERGSLPAGHGALGGVSRHFNGPGGSGKMI